MSSEWTAATLGEAADLVTGYPFKSADFSEEASGPRLVRGASVGIGELLDQPPFLPEEKVTDDLSAYSLREGDVVLAMDGTWTARGMKWSRVREEHLPALLVQRVARLRVKPGFDQHFLWCLVASPGFATYIRGVETGTTIAHISPSQIKSYQFRSPDLKEQRRIAGVATALDDKIDRNRHLSETLETIARALFRSWFVDFDPFRRGRFVATEAGQLPEGWRCGTVRDLCGAIYSGGTPNTREPAYWGGDLPWLSSGETRKTFIVDTEKRITAAGASSSSTRLAPAYSTVVASAGQGNTRGQTSLLTIQSYVNQSVVVLTANELASTALHLFFDLERRYDEFRRVSDTHSSRGSLTTKLLAGLPAVLPPVEVVQEFDAVVRPLVERAVAAIRESEQLTGLRDTLLPKLIAGDLRVPERYDPDDVLGVLSNKPTAVV